MKTPRKSKTVCLRPYAFGVLFAVLIGAASHAKAQTVNFDDSSSISNGLTTGHVVAAGSLTFSSGAGLSGSGAGAMPSGANNDFLYTTTTGISSAQTSYTVGVYFEAQAPASGATSGNALLAGLSGTAAPVSKTAYSGAGSAGIVGVPNATDASSNAQASLVVGLHFDASTANYGFDAYNNGSNSGLATSSEFSITAGNWYYWQTSVTYNNNNSYTFSATLYNSSSVGLVGSVVGTFTSQTVSNTSLAGAGTLYGLLSSQAGYNDGVAALDNYSLTQAIPEPKETAAIGGIAVCLVALLVRARKSPLRKVTASIK